MKNLTSSLLYQRGISLMELMVGVVIGLLVVAVAMGTLMVSRQVGGAVSDSSNIQQQAAYAMHVIGQQIRHANLVRLVPYPDLLGIEDDEIKDDPMSSVILVNESIRRRNSESWSLSNSLKEVEHNGLTGPRMVFINADDLDIDRNIWTANCLGDSPRGAVYSHFILKDNNLTCASSYSGKPESNDYQPVLQNVADFKIWYLIHDSSEGEGKQKIKYANASEVNGADEGWENIQGVEICLTLFGKERTVIPEGATYQSCTGPERYSSITDNRRNERPHFTFRSVFQIRSQGKPKQPPVETS